MKNLIESLWQNMKFDLAIIAVFMVALVMGCSGGGDSSPSTPKKAIPAAYIGNWTGTDGTMMSIRSDNTGEYKAGSTSVTGAAVEVDEDGKEIRFTLLGINTGKFKIDAPASGDSMKLNGVAYKRSGSAATTDLKTSTDTSSKSSAPSEAETAALVKQTMIDFGAAVKDGDFTDFHDKISDAWKKQTTPKELNTTFKAFIDQKLDTGIVQDMKPTFSIAPSVSGGMLNAAGRYETKPPTEFDMKYLKEGGEWKLASIRVKIK